MLANTSGFVYYVSMTGITGAAIKNHAAVGDAVKRIKGHTDLPVAVGFGIKTADDAAIIGRDADGVVVGTAICNAVGGSLVDGKATAGTVAAVHHAGCGSGRAAQGGPRPSMRKRWRAWPKAHAPVGRLPTSKRYAGSSVSPVTRRVEVARTTRFGIRWCPRY